MRVDMLVVKRRGDAHLEINSDNMMMIIEKTNTTKLLDFFESFEEIFNKIDPQQEIPEIKVTVLPYVEPKKQIIDIERRRHHMTEAEIKEMRELKNDGWTTRELATKFNVSEATVYKKMKDE
jgi:hypothetical protein